jgi:DNA-binding winged helix-turn-helix (wHTH) protein/tetratricopeptide (TPR) repeat protein
MKSQRSLSRSPGQISDLPETSSRSEAVQPQAYTFGPFRLIPEERILRRGEQVLHLPPKAFETLLLLLRNPGHLMRKDELMTALWPDSFVEEDSLASKISLLRRILRDAGAVGDCIETVPKQGYRFTAPVTQVWPGGSTAGTALPEKVEAQPQAVTRFVALPFRIVNGGSRSAFLAHGLPEAVSAALAGLRSLTIRSTLLGARLAEVQPDPRRIAQEAEVDMLLTGTILCDGDQLRVTAELVHAPTGTLTGSYVCQTGRDNLITVQDCLTHGIVDSLMLRLTEREKRILAHNVPASARAYEFYLRANYMLQERSVANVTMARDLYRECLAEDPDYAPAWAHLGRCYRFLAKFGQGSPDLAEAKWAFGRAFALSPDLPAAHNLYTPFEADSGHAQEAMVRLLGCATHHPNDPELFTGLVQACRYSGLLEESARAHLHARQLDSRAMTSVAHTFFLMGDYERALEFYPTGVSVYMDLAVLATAGRETEAAEKMKQRRSPGGQFSALMESLRHHFEGDSAGSLRIARQALASGPPLDPEMKFYLIRHLARGGAHEDALQAIQDLTSGGFFSSIALRGDPWLRPLSRLAGYQAALDEVLRRETLAKSLFQASGGDQILS